MDHQGRSRTIRMKIPVHLELISLARKIWKFFKIFRKFHSVKKYLQILYERSNHLLVLFEMEQCLNDVLF